MNFRFSSVKELSRDGLSLIVLALIFALTELLIIPGVYALFRFKDSQTLISEMVLLLHSLNSISTWLNFVIFTLASIVIFSFLIIVRFFLSRFQRKYHRTVFQMVGIGLLNFFSFSVFFFHALDSLASFLRKLIFILLLISIYFLWLFLVWIFRKKVSSVFLILLSTCLFVLVNFARALLILYRISPGLGGSILVALSAFILVVLCIWLGIWLEKNSSILINWLIRIFGLFIFGFGIWVILLPGIAWLKFYFKPSRNLGAENQPNIIMIVMDTVRQDHLSVYGYNRRTTPFLEELAKSGVIFEKAYSTSSWTLDSHASFFTGLLPSEHNCTYENLRLGSEFVTLAELLKQEGYFTIGWSNNPLLNYSSGLIQGFDRFVDNNQFDLYTGEFLRKVWLNQFPELVSDNGAKLTNKTLFRWLDRFARKRVPFFLFLNYMEAHTPYPRNLLAYNFFHNPEQAQKRYPPLNWDLYNCKKEQEEKVKINAEKWYDGSIFYLDSELRRVFERLNQKGLGQKSIIVILSDHGESFGEHNWWGHGVNLYNTDLWVPLIISYSGVLSPKSVSQPFSLKNLPQLLLRLKQAQKESELEDLLNQTEPIFAEVMKPVMYLERMSNTCPETDFSWLDRRQKALILGENKLLWDSRGGWEFYQLKDDPQESNNLFSYQPQELRDLQVLMEEFILKHPYSTKKAGINSRTINALKSLGYLK